MHVFNNNLSLYTEFTELWIKKKPVETKNISNIKSKFLEYVSYRVDTMYFTVCTLDKYLCKILEYLALNKFI